MAQLHRGWSSRCCSRHGSSSGSSSSWAGRNSPRGSQRRVLAAAQLQPLDSAALGSWQHAPPDLLHQLADLEAGGFNPVQLILPVSAVLAGAAALKFYLYSQLEYVTAAMLTKYVPKGGTGAKVIQFGGGTRELYYYPRDVMTVINVGEKANKGLMEQAGVTAAVPTIVKQQPITDLSFQPPDSIDAVVSLGQLCQLSQQQRQACLEEVARVLKPGMPLVFVEPLAEGGSPLRGLVGVSAGGQPLPTAALQALQDSPAFSFVQFDVALQGQDPHAVGVAVRSESYRPRQQRSAPDEQDDDDSSSSKRRKAKAPKAANKGFSA